MTFWIHFWQVLLGFTYPDGANLDELCWPTFRIMKCKWYICNFPCQQSSSVCRFPRSVSPNRPYKELILSIGIPAAINLLLVSTIERNVEWGHQDGWCGNDYTVLFQIKIKNKININYNCHIMHTIMETFEY